jgi:uncharacterized membrane protein YtjA (UPF0391 family)
MPGRRRTHRARERRRGREAGAFYKGAPASRRTRREKTCSRAHGMDLATRSCDLEKETSMLSWALIFLVVALIAGLLGFTGIAGAATGIAKVLFFVFLVVFLISLVAGQGGRAPL